MHRILASLISFGLLCTAWPARAQPASLSNIPSSEPAWAPHGITFGEQPVARKRRPPLGPGRVTGELVAGAAFGGVFALAGLTAGATAADAYGHVDRDGACDALCAELDHQGRVEKGALIGAAIAYPLGTGLGVAWVGNAGKQKGSFGAAIGGSYLGALAGALVGEAAGNSVIGFLVGAPIGATIAFNGTRKYDRPGTGLVSVDRGRARWSIPAVSVSPDPLRAQRTITSIRVMDGRF